MLKISFRYRREQPALCGIDLSCLCHVASYIDEMATIWLLRICDMTSFAHCRMFFWNAFLSFVIPSDLSNSVMLVVSITLALWIRMICIICSFLQLWMPTNRHFIAFCSFHLASRNVLQIMFLRLKCSIISGHILAISSKHFICLKKSLSAFHKIT